MIAEYISRLCGELHIGQRLRQKYVLSTLRKLNLSGKRILDAGCGTGSYAFKLAEWFPTVFIDAVDIRIDRATSEKAPHNLKFLQKDLRDFVSPSTYDLIYSVDVLEHITDDTKVLSNLYVSLKPNGLFSIHVPLLSQNFTPHKFLVKHFPIPSGSDHVREGCTPSELIKKLEEAGFSIQKTINTFGWFGSLAWCLMKIVENNRLRYRITLHPLNLLLMQIDYWLPNKKAEGILILAQK